MKIPSTRNIFYITSLLYAIILVVEYFTKGVVTIPTLLICSLASTFLFIVMKVDEHEQARRQIDAMFAHNDLVSHLKDQIKKDAQTRTQEQKVELEEKEPNG